MRQEGGQQHRKRFGQHLCNAIYKIQIGKEGGTRPSKQFEYCIYLHEKSFHHSGTQGCQSGSVGQVSQISLMV